MPIIVGSPSIDPPLEAFKKGVGVRSGLRMTWTGFNGDTFDLGDPDGGVVVVKGGVRGLDMPEVTNYRSEAPAIAGSRYRGTRTPQREAFWPFYIFHDGSAQQWVDLNNAFWATMNPAQVGTWTVTSPGGSERSLECRYEGTDAGFERDPALFGWSLYSVSLIAEQPYWRGEEITQRFPTTAPTAFFGPPNLINISDGSVDGTKMMRNPGDVPAWLTWYLTGPLTTSEVGVRHTQIPNIAALAAGETLTIYTQPDLMIAVDQDGDEVALHRTATFDSIPAGGAAAVAITTGVAPPGGSITASLTPYYYRAF